MFAAHKSATPSGGQQFIEDVFSVTNYTGNGATQTINNGIDLAGEGGMVWIKNRNFAANNAVWDTVRGAGASLSNNKALISNSTAGETAYSKFDYINAFGASGFTVTEEGGTPATADRVANASGSNYASWSFRQAPSFFRIVTWTGNGVAGRQIPHDLGVAPGMIAVKCTSAAGIWRVFFPSVLGVGQYLDLSSTVAASPSGALNSTAPTATEFTVAATGVNESGQTYVAYLFAHDDSDDGLIQCGSFTTNSSGIGAINHGWAEGAQYLDIKAASTTGDWEIYDTARTSGFSGNDARLRANLSNAEDSVARLSASGASISLSGLSASAIYIYKVVRAPSA